MIGCSSSVWVIVVASPVSASRSWLRRLIWSLSLRSRSIATRLSTSR